MAPLLAYLLDRHSGLFGEKGTCVRLFQKRHNHKKGPCLLWWLSHQS